MLNHPQLAALERFALHGRKQALASSVWAPGSAEQAFFTGLDALHDGDLQAAQRQVDALRRMRHIEWYEELRLRLKLATWDSTDGNETERSHILEQLRSAAGIDLDELEVDDICGAELLSSEQPALPCQLLPEQVSDDAFLNEALAAGLADGAYAAGQQTDYNRMLLFAMEEPPEVAHGAYDAEQWQHIRWLMLRSTKNPAVLSGVVDFIARRLLNGRAHAVMSEVPLAQLTLPQLHQLADAWPDAKSSNHWIAAVVLKMYPQQPVGQASVAQRSVFLDRVQQFCDSLPLEGGWLRVRLLQARLQLSEDADTAEAGVFTEYVRCSGHIAGFSRRGFSGVLPWRKMDQPDVIRNYEDLPWTGNLLDVDTGGGLQQFEMHHMRRVIAHHLTLGDVDTVRSQWKALFDVEYEARMVAEASLLAGTGDAADHAQRLEPSGARQYFPDVQELQDRVELSFASSNPRHIIASQGIILYMDIKNVPSMLVKVYEINTRTYYTTSKSQVPINIQLEGLGATSEQNFDFAQYPAMLRHRESISMDDLQGKRGVFVIEAVGGGLKSRAVLQKGGLHHIARVCAAGTAITILDDKMQVVTDGRVWVNGDEYPVAAASGEAMIPFVASHGGVQPAVLLGADDFAALATVDLQGESYCLAAGFWADREALQPGGLARLLMWAALRGPDGGNLPLKLLQDVLLTIMFTDCDGVDSRQTFRDIKLPGAAQASEFDIRLPERCASVAVELTARVELLAPGGEQFQTLQQWHRWDINDRDSGSVIGDVHLWCKPDGVFTLQTLGRCGETIQRQNVTVQLQHNVVPGFSRDFRLQTDADGSISLAKLPNGISRLTAKLGSGTERQWDLPFIQPLLPSHLTLVADSPAEIIIDYKPATTNAALLGLEGVQLVRQAAPCGSSHNGEQDYGQMQSGGAVEDMADCLNIAPDGRLALGSVPEGTHKLYLPRTDQCIDLLAVKSTSELQRASGAVLLGDHVASTLSMQEPLRVVKMRASSLEGVHIHLAGAAAGAARVTLAMSRFVPSAPNEQLSHSATAAAPPPLQLHHNFQVQFSAYSSGKRLSEETRYCLERRRLEQQGNIRMGNQCAKPSLLVHPWAVRKTSAEERQTRGGEEHNADREHGVALRKCAAPGAYPAQMMHQQIGGRGAFTPPRLGFCTAPALLSNLKVGADGKLELSTAALQQSGVDLAKGGFTAVSVVAVTPAEVASSFGAVEAPAIPAPIRDQGLVRPLAAQSRYIQVSAVESLLPGAHLRITDATSSRINLCDDTSKLWSLYGTMLADRGQEQEFWRAFEFLPQWSVLSHAEKVARLRDHACHELHFFVQQREPELFQSAVLPLLQDKLDSELDPIDLWLLGRRQDLVARHGSPAAFAQLNALERCLVAAAAGTAKQLAADMAARCRHALRDRNAAAEVRKRFDIALQAADPAKEGGVAATLESWKQDTAKAAKPPPPPAPMAAMATFGAPRGGGGPGAFASAPPHMPVGQPMARRRAAAPATESEYDDDVNFEEEHEDGADGWELFEGPNEGSGADTELGFELLDNEEGENSSPGQGHDSDDLVLRQKQRQQRAYQPPEPTQEWVEAGFWKRRRASATFDGSGHASACVPESLFWADYAAHLGANSREPFLSRHLAHAGNTFTDAVAALAVTGVGFHGPAGGHRVTSSASGVTITAAAAAVAFHRQVQAIDDVDGATADAKPGAGLSVVQRLYDAIDRYVEDVDTGEQVERSVSGPLHVGRPYGYHIIVSSTSAVPLALDVLAQVPQGALPLEQRPFAWCTRINVAPYTSATLDLPFYFPQPSERPSSFNQFPVTVSRDSRMLAASDMGSTLSVEYSPAIAAAAANGFDWGTFSRTASDEEILVYLRVGDLARAHLPALRRRCRQRAFFAAAIEALRARLAWCPELWRFALMHGDQRALQELLPTLQPLLNKLTPPIDTTLLRMPVQEHKEFWPLVARRAHALGGRPAIEDGGLRQASAELLGSLARQPAPPPAEKLKAAVLLLAQDRVDEAEELVFELRTQADSLPPMQMDYLAAWLALAAPPQQLDLATAAAAVERHSNVADRHWAARWAQLRDVVSGAQTSIAAGDEAGPPCTEQQLPSLAIVSGPAPGQVTLRHHGLPAATMAVYEMDVELLFSAQPFGQTLASGGLRRGGVNPAYVKPRAAAQVQLSEAQEETVVTLAELLPGLSDGGGNVLVEASAEGVPPAMASCYSNGLRVRVTPRAGLLQAFRPADAGNAERHPAVATYVKVFARRSGSSAAVFHKDGYTDVRGRFDYVSTTSGRTGTTDGVIERFALLVTSQHWGAAIEEAQPPLTLP